MEELRDTAEHKIDTPFGPPSDVLVGGKLGERQVYFLPRHGRGHRILPHEINYRANIYALRSLNVRWIISVAAVGSLQEKYAPRDLVLPSQFSIAPVNGRRIHFSAKALPRTLDSPNRSARTCATCWLNRPGHWDTPFTTAALT
jgi:Purine nucleoside phosphorylase